MSAPRCNRGHTIAPPNVRPNGRCLACSRAHAYLQAHPGADMQAVSDWHYMRIMRARTPVNDTTDRNPDGMA